MYNLNLLFSPSSIMLSILQVIILLLLAPLMSGISRKVRARMHSRIGPLGIGGFFQDYRDIFKLLKRQEIAPHGSGIIFRITPFVLLLSMVPVAMSLPVITQDSLLVGTSDIITLVYLFSIYRFFFALSGLDSGSIFAGLGSSRELLIGILVEPVFVLGLIVVALIADSTNIGVISIMSSTNWGGVTPLATALAMVACAFAVFIEMGKIPFDYPEAEQELQEGPLTEYSGAGLALVSWGIKFKQLIVASLFISVFIPFGSVDLAALTPISFVTSLFLFTIKLIFVFVLASVYENSLARGRFLLTSKVTWLGFGVAALAFVFYFIKL